MGLAGLTLCLVSMGLCASGESSKGDLEAPLREAYVETGQVRRSTVALGRGLEVEYLEAGSGSTVVVFCHGAAFTAETWKYVGVLDALASNGARAIALNLPGRGRTPKALSEWRSSLLVEFARALSLPKTLIVVAASMGGTYGLPFVLDPGPFDIAGYVTVAGVLSSIEPADVVETPVLAIYGSEDPRLRVDRTMFPSTAFPNAQLVVFDKAPHPCYLKDKDAARRFTDLVLDFAGLATHNLRVAAAASA